LCHQLGLRSTAAAPASAGSAVHVAHATAPGSIGGPFFSGFSATIASWVAYRLPSKVMRTIRVAASGWNRHPEGYGLHSAMIRSFRHRGLKRLFERGDRAQVRPDMLAKVENVLALLDRAASAEDMALPGLRLHQLRGDLRGFWSVTVSANWRVIWRFDGRDVVDVDLIDYH
jgi:toxin HigB-1